MIVHERILTARQMPVLRAAGPFARRAGFYLAGGTAIALRFGHRRSEDFDWFAPALAHPDTLLSDLRTEGLTVEGAQISAGTLLGRVDNVKVSFFEFRYPLLEQPEHWQGGDTNLCSVRDLGAMKLLAIAQRGARKDFVDVHELLQHEVALRSMLDDFSQKFAVDGISALRGLTYFDDAEKEPMPEMLMPTTWPTIRRQIEAAVREVTR